MSENIAPDFLNERVEKITAQNTDLEERRRAARQITEKALADAAVDQAGKEKTTNTGMFYLQERNDASRAIVTKKLAEAEEERVWHEGNRAASSDQLAVRPQIASNPSGPNPVEKPRQDVGWEWR